MKRRGCGCHGLLKGGPALLILREGGGGGRMKAGVRGVLFAFAEFELQLADHEPVVRVNISIPEDPGVL